MIHDTIISNIPFLNNGIQDSDYYSKEYKALWKIFSLIKDWKVFYFDFELGNDNLYQTALDFSKNFLIKMPYSNCIFIYRKRENTEALFLVNTNNSDGNEFLLSGIATKEEGNQIAFGDAHTYCKFNLHGLDQFFSYSTRKEKAKAYSNDSTSMYRIVMESLMALSTKSCARESVEISEKLQNARAKKGKPALLPYVMVKGYSHSINRGGTHASPIPHWRRGHVRNYKGKIIPIDPCIVNAQMGEPLQRPYVIK